MGSLHVSMGPRDGPVSLKNIWTSLQKVKHSYPLIHQAHPRYVYQRARYIHMKIHM